MDIEVINNSVLRLLYEHRYVFAFLGAILEGNFIMILSGVLFRLGFFNFWALGAVLVNGYFLNGVGWYLIGRIGGNVIIERFIKRKKFGKKVIDRLEKYSHRHSAKTIFLTRITYGISMFTFMIAGSLKMNLKKFLSVSFIATICWVLIMVSLGYGFGVGLQTLNKVTKGITIGIIIVIIILIVLISLSFIAWMRYFSRTQFVKDLENHESPFLSKIGEIITKSFNHKDKKIN
jgi:membrane protein DedA with SNARE-associated domain